MSKSAPPQPEKPFGGDEIDHAKPAGGAPVKK